jgi:hypothetical protein
MKLMKTSEAESFAASVRRYEMEVIRVDCLRSHGILTLLVLVLLSHNVPSRTGKTQGPIPSDMDRELHDLDIQTLEIPVTKLLYLGST